MSIDIKEAAHRLGKSEKTLRRWVHTGRMAAHLEEGRLMFAVSDIEAHQVAPSDTQRIEALEYHITELETRIGTLERLYELEHQKPTRLRKSPPRPVQTQPGHSTMPENLVGWREFSRLHNIGQSTVQYDIEHGKLPTVLGKWKMGRTWVEKALDATGRARFYELYHNKPHFQPCAECPHTL